MREQCPSYLLGDEDRKRIDRMLSLIHLFITELIEDRQLRFGMEDDRAFDEFEAYLERIATERSRAEAVPPDF
jgi:hypothetical protein